MPARTVTLLACRLALVLAAVTGPALAQPASGQSGDDPKTVEARGHFQSGVKLYSAKNWQGALAEFDAAYKLKPGPSSLKNIALCQKELFRYTDAIDTLKKALDRHAAEMSETEQQSVREAIAELGALVGSIVVRVVPAEARVLLDGRPLERREIGTSIRLNTGEHVLTADAPGHARAARTIRVAGGQKDVVVDFTLVQNAGIVAVTSKDPKAAIAIDGKAMAFSTWRGPLDPGRHYVQVYRDGFKQFEQYFVVEIGKPIEIEAVLVKDERPPPSKPVDQRGFYALGVLSAVGLRNAPGGLEIDQSEISGSSVGVRAGYRLWTPVGVELLLEGGTHKVEKACDTTATGHKCGTATALERTFTLDSLRFGPNLRIMSAGESLRFTSVIGAGAVRHEIDLEPPSEDGVSKVPGGNAKGWDPYFLVEVGAQYNLSHVVFELCGLVFIDGASSAKGNGDDGRTWTPFEDTGGLIMGGLGLRVGWTEWKPR